MPEVPRRFNEDAVARYESALRAMCRSWPKPIAIDPHPLSKETFRSRFRDALRGALEFHQGPEDLRTMLMKLSDTVTVAECEGELMIGPTLALRNRAVKPLQAGQLVSGIATLADNETGIVGPDKEIICALATLLSAGILSDARISGVDETFIYSCLPADYPGGAQQNADGSFTLY